MVKYSFSEDSEVSLSEVVQRQGRLIDHLSYEVTEQKHIIRYLVDKLELVNLDGEFRDRVPYRPYQVPHFQSSQPRPVTSFGSLCVANPGNGGYNIKYFKCQ